MKKKLRNSQNTRKHTQGIADFKTKTIDLFREFRVFRSLKLWAAKH